MSKRAAIDLTSISQPRGLAVFFSEAKARRFALDCGWQGGDTKLVRFRFQELWCVGQVTQGSLVLLKQDKSTTEVPWNGTHI
jgi:hypothetical protein